MKMNQRMLKIAVTTALTVAFAVPAFASPFSDVPVKHWSYDAVTKLKQAGIVDGYSDNTFKGDKTVTRYEMAQIVAKAMTKSLNSDQKNMVDQLAKEFAVELNTMGVKVDGLQNQIDNMVKISGDARVRYENTKDTVDSTDFRARINFDGKISDSLKFNTRLTTGNIGYNQNTATTINLDTLNVGFKAFGLNNTIGRQAVTLGSGMIFDDKMTGIATNIADVKLFAGNTNKAERVYAAEYSTNLLGANLTADYLKNNTTGDKFYGANAAFGVAEGVTANVEYIKNQNISDATAMAYGLKFNNIGLTATYRDVKAGAYTGYSSMAGDLNGIAAGTAFKGMEYQYDKAIDKNAALNVKYQAFDNMKSRTAATVNVKF